MARPKQGVLLSLIVVALVGVSEAAWNKAQPKRRLRKHKNQVFQAPQKGERRKGSHKSDYKHDEDEYPPYLSGFYEYEDHAEAGFPDPTEHPTHFHIHDGNTHHPTYYPTTSPTFFPTWSGEETVYKYGGKKAKGAKYAKGTKAKSAKAKGVKTKNIKKAKAVDHGAVYEVIYEDGYEETLMPDDEYHDTYYPGDPLYHYQVDDGNSVSVPHNHQGEIYPKTSYGHSHPYGNVAHSHSQVPHASPVVPPNGHHDVLCNSSKSKSKKGSKSAKSKKGQYHRFHEPVEIMDAEFGYDCTSISKSAKSAKSIKSKKKSKSYGRGSMMMKRKYF